MLIRRVKVSVLRRIAYVHARNSFTSVPDVDIDVSTAITRSSIRFYSLVSGGSTSGMFPYTERPYV